MFSFLVSPFPHLVCREVIIVILLLTSRNLSHHKLNGQIPPEIGKLDRLEILYVFSLIHFPGFLFFCFNWLPKYLFGIKEKILAICFAANLITTIFMERFPQNWETAPVCEQCKSESYSCLFTVLRRPKIILVSKASLPYY